MSGRELSIVLLVLLGAVILLPALWMTVGVGGMMGPMHMGGWYGRPWGWGWGGLLVLALVVVGAILIARGLLDRGGSDEALAILRQRLARGEITPEQYEELKRTLGR
ncbi:MAG TPA: SHOCT domain-containing protein [bacterium]|nr:SHOCT domain-containing protein [bacterium]